MLQWPRPTDSQIFGTVLPKASGSSGVPMVVVKISSAGLRQIRADRRSSSCRAAWDCRVDTKGSERCNVLSEVAVARCFSLLALESDLRGE